ncbi:uroporphyrinogen decarboxylase [Citromicrobium sp. RCC1885]|uniref:uroporphyrinogen decarboxylase n=1 Tax=unclassified Citromicrobium TaxID=2630544 RepID=UPI0006C8F933|nr:MULTISPECIES: uroporphyrinogen decarboxylase [unclassified Citromicrobium]KPM21316.1 uroporphyrinogen decarboxylase [Citromicrobium sp. RCC1885]KPM29396.1 uroporphyrinogen decarboxylase [Citromicrobium sp. RCC1878]OAM06663.1 uroporphyrinogen decarboxylase [Citromicrobium sp. RCC1897]|tara:strand:- start:1043 stop:2068 length:1026 start_codon:yes stop_codon:yes gene_type:complete
MPGPLLDCLRGERAESPPVWFMRQAGRYLPEYRALRADKGGFLDLVYDSEAACEVTLQPVRRFGFDGAILFSDILIVPHAMGQNLEFLAGEGPKLSPPLVASELAGLSADPSRYDPVYQTVRLCRDQLAPDVTMLGFAGSPWTVATYMIAGEGSRDQHAARAMAYADPGKVEAIIGAIIDQTVGYLRGQIDAGAEAVQLFDSWAGSLAPDEFDRWVIEPNARIVAAIKDSHPDIPVIGFPKGAGEKLPRYAERTGVDAVGLDETLDPEWAHAALPKGMPVQGNLDPMLLLAGGDRLDHTIRHILSALADRPHVFNLGHGIDRHTPIAHVEHALGVLRDWQR